MNIQMKRLNSLKPYANNARTHSRRQIQQIARSIEQFGFTNPVLVSDGGEIVAGHGRVRAAWTGATCARCSMLARPHFMS